MVVASLFLRCSALLGLSSSRPRLGRSRAAALWRLRPQLCPTELSRLRLPKSPRKPTLSRRAASLARCAPIPTCTDHPLTLDPLMMGLSGGGEGGCTSLALTLCEQGPSLPPHLAHLQPTQAPHPFARLMHPFSPLTPSPRCVCNLLADILCRFRPASSSWLRARPWFSWAS